MTNILKFWTPRILYRAWNPCSVRSVASGPKTKHAKHGSIFLNSNSNNNNRPPGRTALKPILWRLYEDVMVQPGKSTLPSAGRGNLNFKSQARILAAVQDFETHDCITEQLTSTEDMISELQQLSNLKVLTPSCLKYREHIVECLASRITQMSKVELFQSAESVRTFNNTEIFFRPFLRTVLEKWDYLEIKTEEFLHIMFFISLLRTAPVELLAKSEEFLVENIQYFDSREVSFICFACFSSNYRFKKFTIVDAIAKKTITGASELSLPQISNIMKVLRHAGYNSMEFFRAITPVLVNLKIPLANSLTDLCHICQCFSSARYRDTEFLDSIAKSVKRILTQREAHREKDVSRILWTFANFNFKPSDDLVEVAISQWTEENNQALQFPEAFVECSMALALLGIYPHQVHATLSSAAFQRKKQGRRLEQHHQQLLLREGYRIERNSDKKQKFLEELPNIGDIGHNMLHRGGLSQIYEALQKLIIGPNQVNLHFIFKFSQIPDLEFCIHEKDTKKYLQKFEHLETGEIRQPELQNSPKSVVETMLEEKFSEQSSSYTVMPQTVSFHPATNLSGKNGVRKFVIKVYGQNQYCVSEVQLLGLHQMEQRLLTALGYNLIAIPPDVASTLAVAPVEQVVKYLQSQVFQKYVLSSPSAHAKSKKRRQRNKTASV